MRRLIVHIFLSFILVLNLFGVENSNLVFLIPDSPNLLSASVDSSSGDVVLFWEASTDTNIRKYDIFWENQSLELILVDSVYGYPLDNFYISINYGNASGKSEVYGVQAVENNGTLGLYSEFISTLYATVIFDSCMASNTIEWSTKNKLWSSGSTEEFCILRSIENGPYDLAATVSGTQFSYIDNNVNPNSNYSYIVQANKANDTLYSFSNKVGTYTEMAVLPEYINADYSKVLNESSLNVSFTIDPNSEINHYKILRSNSNTGHFDTIYEYFNYPQHNIIHTDNDLNTNEVIYYYKLLGVNYCDINTTVSNIASNIVLSASEEDFIVSLNWNEYSNWLGNIDKYTIYRTPKEDSTEIDGTLSSFSDDLNGFDMQYQETPGRFCYYLIAEEGNSNPYGIKGKSTSNIACINTDHSFIIANALNPNSIHKENRTFKPHFKYLPKEYLFLIYDRWGKKVFETKDPTEAWDGYTLGGKEANEGVYIYKIKITSFSDETTKYTGHVTLVYK